MASPYFQFPSYSNGSSRRGLCASRPTHLVSNARTSTNDDHMNIDLNGPGYGGSGGIQGGTIRHNPPQNYGPNGYPSQMPGAGWNVVDHASSILTPARGTVHSRSTSEHLQTATLGVPEHFGLGGRRRSVPNAFQPISPSQPGFHTESQILQPPPVVDNQYQQHLAQSMNPILFAPRPTPLAIPPNPGNHIPGPHSASPPDTQWYNLQPSPHPHPHPHPHPQLGLGFPSGAPFSHFDQGSLPGISYGGSGGGAADRTSRPSSRPHPYQHRDARKISPAWENVGQMQGAGSPVDLSPVASSSRAALEGWDPATSPGAESEPYPDTPAYTSGAMSEGLDDAAAWKAQQDRERARKKKKEDRKRESDQLQRVKELLGLEKRATRVDSLEKVITFLGGNVPARTNEPTEALQGRVRTERAEQVSGSRKNISRLFNVIGKCMNHASHTPPKRELLLEEVANEIERRKTEGMQSLGPQGGGGPGGNHWMV